MSDIDISDSKRMSDGSILDLLPPKISSEEVDRLLRSLTLTAGDGNCASSMAPSSTALPSTLQKLNGREVLVPACGGVAFYEGQLRPETRRKPGSNDNEEEEIVYIHTSVETETTKATTTREKGSRKNEEVEFNDKNVVAVSLPDAIEWLQKSSTSSQFRKANSKVDPKSTGTTTSAAAAAASSSKRPSPTKQASGLNVQKPLPSRQPDYYDDEATAGPMFNINEEYSEDGRRIAGEAVNLSSRLNAVYGDENPDKFHPSRFGEGDESKTEDAPLDPTRTRDSNEKPPRTTTSTKVSDEEYDRISKRLEELALMEEEESQRQKDGRRKPAKPLASGTATGTPTQARKSKTKASSFGFQKGFLNKNASVGKKKAMKPKTVTTTKPTPKASGTDASTSVTEGGATVTTKGSGTPSSGGVTIDVSQNKVHQIPREGRQQPVPQRKPQSQTNQMLPSTTTNSNRLVDASVFSGQISERAHGGGGSVISKDVASRVAANEQTQSLQHELEQQEKQRNARPKRVSRFKQQRQQEQQQHQEHR